MTPCCRFARSLIPFAALLLSPLLFCVYLYWFIILPPSPTGVTISALFSAPKYLFCNLIDSFVCVSRPQLIALPLGSPVRAPWDKSLLYRTRGSISPLSSNLFACVILCRSAFSPPGACHRSPFTWSTVPEVPSSSPHGGEFRVQAKEDNSTGSPPPSVGLNCCLRLFPFLLQKALLLLLRGTSHWHRWPRSLLVGWLVRAARGRWLYFILSPPQPHMQGYTSVRRH